jgi:hypothetical protein
LPLPRRVLPPFLEMGVVGGTNLFVEKLHLLTEPSPGAMQKPSDKKREFTTALLLAAGLALVCFGGAVLASTFH